MTINEKALQMHEIWNGKIETVAKSRVNSREDLAVAYTPGVAEPCKVIAADKEAGTSNLDFENVWTYEEGKLPTLTAFAD